jgi:hypothetical protein
LILKSNPKEKEKITAQDTAHQNFETEASQATVVLIKCGID